MKRAQPDLLVKSIEAVLAQSPKSVDDRAKFELREALGFASPEIAPQNMALFPDQAQSFFGRALGWFAESKKTDGEHDQRRAQGFLILAALGGNASAAQMLAKNLARDVGQTAKIDEWIDFCFDAVRSKAQAPKIEKPSIDDKANFRTSLILTPDQVDHLCNAIYSRSPEKKMFLVVSVSVYGMTTIPGQVFATDERWDVISRVSGTSLAVWDKDAFLRDTQWDEHMFAASVDFDLRRMAIKAKEDILSGFVGIGVQHDLFETGVRADPSLDLFNTEYSYGMPSNRIGRAASEIFSYLAATSASEDAPELNEETSIADKQPAEAINDVQPRIRIIHDKEIFAPSKDGDEDIQQFVSLNSPIETALAVNPNPIADALAAEFPWMTDVVERMRDDLHLSFYRSIPDIHIRPVVLVGPPSCGKTRFARRFAELSGIAHTRLSGAGMSDNRVLHGTARGWRGHHPCLPLMIISSSKTANPLIIFDEIDKLGGSNHNGHPFETLLNFLENETASRFFDECLQVHVDLSHVNWIMTANDLDKIPPLLRSRIGFVQVRRPSPADFPIILDGILQDLRREMTLPDELLILDDEIRDGLTEAFKGGAEIRNIAAAIRRLLSHDVKARFILH